jgi:hypothetical protein
MSEVVAIRGSGRRDDSLWAVIVASGKTETIANIYPTRDAAMADRDWRATQVAAYAQFLRQARQPAPHYRISLIRRADLPRSWRPLPALGFLWGRLA